MTCGSPSSSRSRSCRRRSRIAAEAFERAGDNELAERVDELALRRAGDSKSATLAHVRAARRAAAKGNEKRALELARHVIEAWSVADTPVLAVGEMKKLVKRLE